MSDLIERKDAINEIEKLKSKLDTKWLQDICMRNGLIYAQRCVMSLPTVNRWIPCSEKLPEIGTDVLIFFPYWKDNPIQVASLMSDGLGWDICGEFNPAMDRVTHWMPLPEKPSGVEK